MCSEKKKDIFCYLDFSEVVSEVFSFNYNVGAYGRCVTGPDRELNPESTNNDIEQIYLCVDLSVREYQEENL